MKILVIGGGGREHALAWKAAQSKNVQQVFVAPGNAGTATDPRIQNVDIAAEDIQGLLAFAEAEAIDLTIVGPEAPLVAGVVDEFSVRGLRCFGPSKNAAQLEGSKAFMKDFLARHGIPTADYANFTKIAEAHAFIDQIGAPCVVKADGLAAGKGVIIAETIADAKAAVNDMLEGNSFGEAGHCVVIEEFLAGEEASFIVMVDGENMLPFATSQDHKAAYDGDQGPNTGGMGAYSPAPVVTDDIFEKIMRKVIRPTVEGMHADRMPYVGFLYAGLMINKEKDNEIKVLEFNCRMGDPETQPIMVRLESDLVELCNAALDGRLDAVEAQWSPQPALGVVMAAKGYPSSYAKGETIANLETVDNATVFHAGTQFVDGTVKTAGGRVLCVTAKGDTVEQAQRTAYAEIDKIDWPTAEFRTDIGYRAIAREQATKN